MSWRDRYQEASFRGIKFHVSRSPSEFGRNKIVHEFVGSTTPYVEDIGKKTGRFPIDGFLIGDDYNFTRDLLIRAAEKEGSGQLIHPFLGIKQVECLRLKVDEDFREGSFAKIKFEFIEAGNKPSGFKFIDQALELIDQANEFIMETVEGFQEAFSVLSAPAFIVQSAAATVDRAGDAILSQNGLGAVQASVSDLSSAVNSLTSESLQLVRSPATLAQRTQKALEALGDSFTDKSDSVRALSTLSKVTFKPNTESPFKTRNRKIEKRNLSAYSTLFKSQALGVSARSLASFVKSQSRLGGQNISINDILALRELILQSLSNLSRESLSYTTYAALTRLKTKLLKSVPGSIELPETRTITLDTPMSVYQLSYRLYRSTTQAKDLMSRNSIANPILIPSGTSIEYVS